MSHSSSHTQEMESQRMAEKQKVFSTLQMRRFLLLERINAALLPLKSGKEVCNSRFFEPSN